MTGVSQDVPPFMLVAGERGWLHGLNVIGLRRQGFTRDELSSLKRAYQLIWRSGMRRTEALQEVKRELDTASPRLAQLVEFVESSSRGIIGPKGMEE
jgi:UDP-N-acetylglucosamine acyltransferase